MVSNRDSQVVSIGPLSRIEINCGFSLTALVTKRSAEELDLKKGKQVYATFKATGVHVIERKQLNPKMPETKAEKLKLNSLIKRRGK